MMITKICDMKKGNK